MGTPDFAVFTLAALKQAGHDIDLVVTQPDKPRGRGHKLSFSPVKEATLTLGLALMQPEKIREQIFVERLYEIAPDVIVVVAFGQILSEAILAIPRYGCVNLHASLLPKYRGAAPIHMAVLNGEKITGNTTMLMDKGMDTGDILLTNKVDIGEDETTGAVHDKLAVSGAQLILQTLAGLQDGNIVPRKQDNKVATYAAKLDRQMESIDWHKSSREIFNKIRGLNPWPTAYTNLQGSRLKILKSRLVDNNDSKGNIPGQYIGETQSGFLVATGDGLLEVLEVQPESKKKMIARNFIQGCKFAPKEEVFGRTIDV